MPIKKSERKETVPTSVRVTPTAARLWDELSARMGLSKAGVLETLLRDRARAEGIPTEAPAATAEKEAVTA